MPPCQQCTAACCRQNGHDYAVMLDPEEIGYTTETFTDDGETIRAIPYKDGQCVYLDQNKCSIYDNRPLRCREFDCSYGYPERISFFLDDNPKVLELLQLTIRTTPNGEA